MKLLVRGTVFADILILYCQVDSLISFTFIGLTSVSCFIRLEKSVIANKSNESKNVCLVFNLSGREISQL